MRRSIILQTCPPVKYIQRTSFIHFGNLPKQSGIKQYAVKIYILSIVSKIVQKSEHLKDCENVMLTINQRFTISEFVVIRLFHSFWYWDYNQVLDFSSLKWFL